MKALGGFDVTKYALSVIIQMSYRKNYKVSGGSRGGLGGFKRTPLEPKSFHFHGEFQEKLVKLHKSIPTQLI